MLVALATALTRLGCKCIVAVFSDARFSHTEVADAARQRGLDVELVPCSGRIDLAAVRRLRQIVKKFGVHVVHSHGYKADAYARAATIGTCLPLIATCHNWPSKQLRMRIYAAIDRAVLSDFDHVIAVSTDVATLLRGWVPAARLGTIANGVDLEQFSPDKQHLQVSPDHRIIVGFVGRFVADKGGAFLLQVAQRVVAQRPDVNFVFIGDGPARDDWEVIASRPGVANHVTFPGVRADMPAVYASFDIMALPSRVEAMPMCILEAMASAKPVVATPVGNIPKLVIPDETGYLADYGDEAAFATSILRLANDEQLRRRMGANGRARVAQHYSADSMAKQYMACYQAALLSRMGAICTQPA
jgi:glycosyltransferase involved in cell wall biosynthesis